MNTRRGAQITAVVVGFFFWILYTLTRPLDYTYDGLCYALDVERSFPNLFHPNHLLYSFVQWVVYSVFSWTGYDGRTIYLMQAVNALISALTVALLGYGLTRRFDARSGWTLAAFFGFGVAFWSEAADPGCYSMAALAAVIWALTLRIPAWSRGAREGALQGLLVLFHQMFLIAAPASILFRPWKEIARYLVVFVVVVGIAYAIPAFLWHGPDIRSAAFWAFGPAGPPPGVEIFSRFWWSTDIVENSRVWLLSLAESLVWTGGFSSPWRWTIDLFVLLVVGCAVARAWKTRLFVVVVLFSIFQFFFYIGALRYRILLWPFLLTLAAPTLMTTRSRTAWGLVWSGLVVMAVLNGFGPIQQRMLPTTNSERTEWVKSRVGPADFFLFEGLPKQSIDNVYLAYFAPEIPARSLKGYAFENGQDLTVLKRDLLDRHQKGQRIVVESTLVPLFPEWKISAQATGPGGYTLVQMTPERQAR